MNAKSTNLLRIMTRVAYILGVLFLSIRVIFVAPDEECIRPICCR